MINEANAKSWVWPALFCVLILSPTLVFLEQLTLWLGTTLLAIAGILGFLALVNLGIYLLINYGYGMRMVWDARYKLSTHALAESLQTLDPAALGVLRMFGAPTWMVRANSDASGVEYILYGTRCRLEFVQYLLKNSGEYLYPQNRFSDNAYHFDPFREVTDRRQHKDFEAWLYSMSMVEWNTGNRSARFINGWTPARILELLDLTDVEFTQPAITGSPQPGELRELD